MRIPERLQDSAYDAELLEFVRVSLKEPERFLDRITYLYEHPRESSREEIELRDGRVFDRYTTPMVDSRDAYVGRIWFFRDISQQRAAEHKLKLFRALVDKSNDRIEVLCPETLGILDVNERVTRDLGYTREEFLTMGVADFDIGLKPEQLVKMRERVLGTGHAVFESVHRRKDGTVFPVEVGLSYASLHPGEYLIGVVRDITERKLAQKAFEESEMRFRTLIEDASDPVAIVERDGTIRYTSPATRGMSGYDPVDLVGKRFMEFIHADDAERVAGQLVSVIASPASVQRIIARIRRKDGTWLTAEAAVMNRIGVAPIDGLVVTIRDVTLRERSVRALAAISATNAAMLRASEERAFADQICRIMVEIGGYPMAWIGRPQVDEQKSIAVVAQAGEGSKAYLDAARLVWGEVGEGGGPTGAAVRTGRIQMSREYAQNIASPDQKAEATELGFISCLAIPMVGPAGTFGVLTLYAGDPAAFDAEEIKLLEQLAADLSYGIETMRGRKQHAMDLERLEQTMESTIQTLAATVEKRDPYTAGHQRRVVQLCMAIAAELGLSQERIKGLELAAMIHDIGKIEIPAEILSKPGKLTEIEYLLVKSHAQAGYEILKNIEFPWPIAQVVQQHHEKLNGSGYPNGLKGDQILFESKILTVADVVEALSSHRPYRPAWPLDAALDVVVKGRDIEYDPAPVDACVRLFRAKGFAFR